MESITFKSRQQFLSEFFNKDRVDFLRTIKNIEIKKDDRDNKTFNEKFILGTYVKFNYLICDKFKIFCKFLKPFTYFLYSFTYYENFLYDKFLFFSRLDLYLITQIFNVNELVNKDVNFNIKYPSPEPYSHIEDYNFLRSIKTEDIFNDSIKNIIRLEMGIQTGYFNINREEYICLGGIDEELQLQREREQRERQQRELQQLPEEIQQEERELQEREQQERIRQQREREQQELQQEREREHQLTREIQQLIEELRQQKKREIQLREERQQKLRKERKELQQLPEEIRLQRERQELQREREQQEERDLQEERILQKVREQRELQRELRKRERQLQIIEEIRERRQEERRQEERRQEERERRELQRRQEERERRERRERENIINSSQCFKSEECVICYTNPPNVLFCNCGHICFCSECEKLKNSNRCPICKIENKIIRVLN